MSPLWVYIRVAPPGCGCPHNFGGMPSDGVTSWMNRVIFQTIDRSRTKYGNANACQHYIALPIDADMQEMRERPSVVSLLSEI